MMQVVRRLGPVTTNIRRSLVVMHLLLAGCGMMPAVAFAQDADAPAASDGGEKAARPKKAPPKPAPKPHEAAKPNAAATPTPNAKFGAWVVFCDAKKAPTDPANCIALISVARDKVDTRKIVIMGVTKHDNALEFFTQTPTTVELKPGIDIQYEGRGPRHFDYGSCEPALCTVKVPLDDALYEEIVATPKATVSWTGLSVGQVKVLFGTEGAKEAIDYLRAQ